MVKVKGVEEMGFHHHLRKRLGHLKQKLNIYKLTFMAKKIDLLGRHQFPLFML